MSIRLNTFLLLLASSISLTAQIQHGTSVNSVYHRGSNEVGGSISITVTDDSFSRASPETPIFWELKFERGARLAETLVDLSSDNPNTNRPIYLPLSFPNISQHDSLSIAAPSDAVSIVRWVAGEGVVWVSMKRSSQTWVLLNDALSAPTDDYPVGFTLGISARTSWESLSARHSKNLPFSSRDADALSDAFPSAVSTLLCFDLSSSQLGSTGIQSQLSYSSAFYDHTAESESGVFAPGNSLDIQQFGSWSVARGVALDFGAAFEGKPAALAPCEDVNEQNIQNHMVFQPLGSGPWELNAKVHTGSFLTLSTEDSSDYGFEGDGAFFVGDGISPGVIESDPESAFSFGGRTLYRSVKIIWDSEPLSFEDAHIGVAATLNYSCEALPESLLIHYSLTLMNHDNGLDQAPFDGPGQNRNCAQTPYVAASGIWRHSEVAGSRVASHVTRSGHGFTTQIILANISDEQQPFALHPSTMDGVDLPGKTGILEPGETLEMGASDFFETDQVSHFRMNASEQVKLTLVYQAERDNTGPAHVGDSPEASHWRFYPGNQAITWDGIAALNRGGFASSVEIIQFSNDGQILAQETLATDLTPNGKLLWVLSPSFEAVPQAYFVLSSSQPLSVIGLRGDLDGNFLWENQLIALSTEE